MTAPPPSALLALSRHTRDHSDLWAAVGPKQIPYRIRTHYVVGKDPWTEVQRMGSIPEGVSYSLLDNVPGCTGK